MELPTRAIISKITALVISWHLVALGNNTLAKLVLEEFNYPLTVTMVQFVLTTLLTWPLIACKIVDTSKETPLKETGKIWIKWLIPLSLAKVVTSTMSHWSIAGLSLSYVHTVKASMPIFTVFFLRFLFKEKQSIPVYLSLVPIITGIGIATWTENEFQIFGLIAAIIATCGFTLQNIFNKQFLKFTSMHKFRLVLIQGQLACLIFTPVWLLTDFWNNFENLKNQFDSENMDWPKVLKIGGMLVADGTLCFVQNLLAFAVLAKVAPLTYSVANATKRIEIVLVGIFISVVPPGVWNIVGMSLAIAGVFCYIYAKHLTNRKKASIGEEGIPVSYGTNNNHFIEGKSNETDNEAQDRVKKELPIHRPLVLESRIMDVENAHSVW